MASESEGGGERKLNSGWAECCSELGGASSLRAPKLSSFSVIVSMADIWEEGGDGQKIIQRLHFLILFSSCEPESGWFAILHAIPKLLFLLRELRIEERRMKWTVLMTYKEPWARICPSQKPSYRPTPPLLDYIY